jgi:hypothetical protein
MNWLHHNLGTYFAVYSIDPKIMDEKNSGDNEFGSAGSQTIIEEKMTGNGLTEISVVIQNRSFNRSEGFLIEVLENGKAVESLACHALDADMQTLAPIHDYLRAQGQLCKFKIRDCSSQFDVSSFLEIASENGHLQTLDFFFVVVYTPESLGKLRSHPGLETICFTGPCESGPPSRDGFDPVIIYEEVVEKNQLFAQIITTCPRLQHVKFFCDNLSLPIRLALLHVRPEITLELDTNPRFNEESIKAWRSLLDNYPNRVNIRFLLLEPFDIIHPATLPELASLIGSASVHALSIRFHSGLPRNVTTGNSTLMQDLTSFTRLITSGQKNLLRVIEFDGCCSPDEYRMLVGCISDFQSIEELNFHFPHLTAHNHVHSTMQEQFLTALHKNASIQKCQFGFVGRRLEIVESAAVDVATLHSILHRNKSIPGMLASTDLIPLSVWPHVFRTLQKTNAAMTLIYQGLRGGLTCMLPATFENDDANCSIESCPSGSEQERLLLFI